MIVRPFCRGSVSRCFAEPLERRCLLSSSIQVMQGTLHITDTDATSKTLFISQLDAKEGGAKVYFDVNGDGDNTDPGELNGVRMTASRFDIKLSGGQNTVTVSSGGIIRNADLRYRISTNGTKDAITFVVGDDDRTLENTHVSLDIRTGAGASRVSIRPSFMSHSQMDVHFAGGSGNTNLALLSLSHGGSVNFDGTLGNGTNSALFRFFSPSGNGYNVAANEKINIALRGGAGDDSMAFSLSGALPQATIAGTVNVAFMGGGGNNNLSFGPGEITMAGGRLNLLEVGGRGHNTFAVSGSITVDSTGGSVLVVLHGDRNRDQFTTDVKDQSGGMVWSRVAILGS